MNRPFFTAKEFSKDQQLGLATINSIRKHYNLMAKNQNGIISIPDIEKKVFSDVLKELNLSKTEQKIFVENIFDSFIGLLAMFQNSDLVFATLEQIVLGKSDF